MIRDMGNTSCGSIVQDQSHPAPLKYTHIRPAKNLKQDYQRVTPAGLGSTLKRTPPDPKQGQNPQVSRSRWLFGGAGCMGWGSSGLFEVLYGFDQNHRPVVWVPNLLSLYTHFSEQGPILQTPRKQGRDK